MTDLFSRHDRPELTMLRGAFAHLDRDSLVRALAPRQYMIDMYGKAMPRPRLERWVHRDPTRTYTFGGGAPMEPVHPTSLGVAFLDLWTLVENACDARFDSCFANYYRDGSDSIDWHADDEPWIGPVIASVSFGGSREFQMRSKPPAASGGSGRLWKPGPIVERIELGHGDLLVMHAGVQEAWLHRVPKTRKRVGARLNLTFRQTREDTP